MLEPGRFCQSTAKFTLKTADSCGREFPLSSSAVWPLQLTSPSPSPFADLLSLLIFVASHSSTQRTFHLSPNFWLISFHFFFFFYERLDSLETRPHPLFQRSPPSSSVSISTCLLKEGKQAQKMRWVDLHNRQCKNFIYSFIYCTF